MHLTVTEAKAKLTELIKRAEAGEEVILTRHGHEVARLVSLRNAPAVADRKAVIARIRARGGQGLPRGVRGP